METRYHILEDWLQHHCQLGSFYLEALPGDASFRRYYRVRTPAKTYMAMDAPPDRENNCRPFIAIAKALRQHGLQAPEIIANDVERGLMLLTDFGDALLLTGVTTVNADALYTSALRALATLQQVTVPDWVIPAFTAELMEKELVLCEEWFFVKHVGLTLDAATETMLRQFYRLLATTAAAQPQVLMHRDYHAANLMVLPTHDLGILDFQDAFIGPITYDAVSLLRDCYIAWPELSVLKWLHYFKECVPQLADVSMAELIRWFDFMGLQRHLKALLTFARKWHRDDNPNYLQHMPRTLQYIRAAAERYPECAAFAGFFENSVLPAFDKVKSVCVQ